MIHRLEEVRSLEYALPACILENIMTTTKTSKTLKANAIHEAMASYMSSLNSAADDSKKAAGGLAEKVKGLDTRFSELIVQGRKAGMSGAVIASTFAAFEKDALVHFTGTPRLATMKQAFANVRRICAHLGKKVDTGTKDDQGKPIIRDGDDMMFNGDGKLTGLQTAARRYPAANGKASDDKSAQVVTLTQAQLDAASELLGECDWEYALAVKVLSKVNADAKAKATK
jgi:hypothetical protein